MGSFQPGLVRGRLLATCATALLLGLGVASAGDAPEGTDQQDTSHLSQQTDVRDLWAHLRHRPTVGNAPTPAPSSRPFFVVAPTISSKPSTGLALGAGTSIAFVRGDPATTHLSSASAAARVSLKEQTTSSIRFGTFSDGDRWFVQGDNRFQWTSLNTYALGGDSPEASAANLEYDWFRVYETAYRRVARRLFVGGGVNVNDHTHVRADTGALDRTAYATYGAAHGLTANRQVSAGTNVSVLFDTRDNSINAARGWLASSTYRTFFNQFLGGSSSWQELSMDVRTYRRLSRRGRQTLALWFLGDLVTGGTAPYFDLPDTGGDFAGRSARGYSEGRYRGPHLLYGEVEYRATVVPSGLFGVVAFMNTTTLDGAPDQKLFQSFAPAAGGGLRVLLDKRSGTNLCVDYGWGRQRSRGLYLGMQEAF